MNDLLKCTFDNEALEYDFTTKFLIMDYDIIMECIIKKIPYKPDAIFSILDLGCGTGNLLKKIRKRFPKAKIYALDFSEDMINIAKKKKIDSINYITADMLKLRDTRLPYFDIIVSSFVFHNFSSIKEHEEVISMVNNHLNVGGKFILGDLIEFEDGFRAKETQNMLISLMRNNNLSDNEIIKWLGILEVEDTPLTVAKIIDLLKNCNFEQIGVDTFTSNNAVFYAQKKLNVIQLKSELLFHGVRQNNYVKSLYLKQNPNEVWKTGNNGIFITINEINTLVGINHRSNRKSPYEILELDNRMTLTKHGEILNVEIKAMVFPEWFFEKIPSLNNRPFSEFFVYEGEGYLHLAYKRCSFSNEEKCKFCSTQRRINKSDENVNDICQALDYVIARVPDNVHICLGGGTYLPIEENVDYFCTIIKCIRKNNPTIPIWIEMIPPSTEAIDRLIECGATSFGFNIEIWDNNLRKSICPGKSKISREHYLKALKYVINRLGPNRVGSCIIVGLDDYKNIKEAINAFIEKGIEPCILPYKSYNRTNLGEYKIPDSYKYDFFELSYYTAAESIKKGILFSENQGCLKCTCCTIMHDIQSIL